TTTARGPIFTTGPAGLVAGAVSMALGRYVSVSSQRDSEKSLLARDRRELPEMPAAELDELAAIYEAKGVCPRTAAQVVAELPLDPDVLANPLQAAAASAASFTV